MFAEEKKTIERMGPRLQRVLIVDPQPSGPQVITEAMRNLTRGQIWTAATQERGLKLCDTVDPQLVFVDLGSGKFDGVAFTRALRRGVGPARKAPVIMVTGVATAGAIIAARDAGVHEFLRKPFAIKDLLRRLEAVTLRDRDWIEGLGYVGPDRRRFNSGDYSGPLKRRDDTPATPDAERLAQALKILRSAVTDFETDPAQARRAIEVQLGDIKTAATKAADLRLVTAVADLQRYVVQSAKQGQALDGVQLRTRAAALLAYAPAGALAA